MSENKITFPVKLASNNPQSFGIVDATEISGHRSVETLSELYAISDPVLSILKDGSDAIGQEWFVVSEDCKYRLDNWANRKSVAGWTKLPKQELINTKQSVSEKDQQNGYAGLDYNGKIPIEKTYGTTATVTEVETYESLPVTGLSGVIYYVSNTSAQYKWSGSAYIDITDGADNAKKNETSIFDCSNGTSTKYYASLSAAINVVPPVYRTSNRIISYLSTENATTTAVNYQYHGIDSTTWTDLTKWEHIPNQSDLAEIRSDLNEAITALEQEQIQGGVYDVSSHNDGAVFESLSALLGSANLSTLIPTSVRHGGMSIRFIQGSVQSSDNKYVQYRLMSDAWSTYTDDWSIADEGVYIENPEFIYVKTDDEDKILWAIKSDGGIYYGAGVPQQVVDYINERIAELSLDEYEDIVTFLNNLEKGDKNLQTLLNEKVDKEEGKSLIDAEYASTTSTVDNSEFLDVTIDADDKILEGIQADGTKVIGGNLNVFGNMEVSGVSYKIIENPEYLAAWADAEDKIIFGIRTDGKTYVGDANFLKDIDDIKAFLHNITDKNIDWDALSTITIIENPEYIEAKTDSEGKLLAGRTNDGAAFENIGFATPKVSIEGHNIENIEDLEGRSELTTDSEGKILSYRDSSGVKHEEAGIEVKELIFEEDGNKVSSFKDLEEGLNFDDRYVKKENQNSLIKKYRLPKYGIADIIQETFYLSADGWSSYENDVELRQLYTDDDANGVNRVALSRFFAGDTPLIFFAATQVEEVEGVLTGTADVTKVGEKCYYTDTLGINRQQSGIYNVLEHSLEVTVAGQDQMVEQEHSTITMQVRQVIDIPPYKVWGVNKEVEHNCIANIDFGYYLNGTFYVGVKYQGTSTLYMKKRNFRFTFYKKSQYSSLSKNKDKIKVGEMIRQSGFNLKANIYDRTRFKESVLNIMFMAIWENRDKYDSYPWIDNNSPYTGATGIIKGFPIRLNIGGEFFGIMIYGLKKDEANYCLDGDKSGIFVSGIGGFWYDSTKVENEIEDEVPQDTAEALHTLVEFVNGRLQDEPFDKEHIPIRMSVIDFIDYLICLQVFYLRDNNANNMILYSAIDKKKFYPFFYDLDLSLHFDSAPVTNDVFNPSTSYDAGSNFVWTNFYAVYKDEVINRYGELRNSILNEQYMKSVYENFVKEIPYADIALENSKWSASATAESFEEILNMFKTRIEYLDIEYYKI